MIANLVLIVVILAAAVLSGMVGAQIARYRFLRLLRELNAERDLRDQAMGADLIRQAERRVNL